MHDEPLTRQTEPSHPTRWTLLVGFSLLASGAVGGAAWASWLAHGGEGDQRATPVQAPVPVQATAPPAPEVVVIEPSCPAPPPPQVVTVEVPVTPTPQFGPGSCPDRDAPRDKALGVPWGEAGDDQRMLDGETWLGVAVSARKHGYLAVWNRQKILFSSSDGRHFRQLLDGPGEVYDVALDCRGGVYALRGDQRGFTVGYAAGDEEGWRYMNLRDQGWFGGEDRKEEDRAYGAVSLLAGAGWVAVTAPPHWFGKEHLGTQNILAVSRDGGVSWSYPDIPEAGYVERISALSIDDRSRLQMLAFEGDCMYNGTSLLTVKLTSGDTVRATQLSTQEQTDAIVDRGWSYDTESCDAPLCTYNWRAAPKGEDSYHDIEWRPVSGVPGQADAAAGPTVAGITTTAERREPVILKNGRVYALVDGEVLRLRAGKAKSIGSDIPDEVSFVAMDSSDRLVGLSTDGKLIRWSRRHGVRWLRGQKPDWP